MTITLANSNSQLSGGTSASVPYTTTAAHQIIVLITGSENNSAVAPATVSTVTDTNSLTWHKRKSQSFLSPSSPNTYDNTEMWWAHAPTAVSGTINVTMSSAVDAGGMISLSFAGIPNTAAPWDANASLPATVTNPTASAIAPSVTISTTSTVSYVLEIWSSPTTNNQQEIAPFGTTGMGGVNNNGGVNDSHMFVAGAAFTSPQSSLVAHLNFANDRWGFIVDALSGDAPSGISGTWATTEAMDTFAATGYPGFYGQTGYLNTTEAQDVFAAAGYPAIAGTLTVTEAPDVFSAYGRQPIQGPWHTTEAPDVFAAVGLGRGEDGVWHTTEAPDIFAAMGNAPVTGTFVITELPDRFRAIGAGVTQVRRRRRFFVT